MLMVVLLAMICCANAYSWFQVDADVIINPRLIKVRVTNYESAVLQCQGRVYGETQYGQVGSANFYLSSLHVGSYGYAYLNSYGNSYFVNGWADVRCRFIGHY